MRLVNGLDMDSDDIPQDVRDAWEAAALLYPGDRCCIKFVDDGGRKVRVIRLSDNDITDVELTP